MILSRNDMLVQSFKWITEVSRSRPDTVVLTLVHVTYRNVDFESVFGSLLTVA